MNSRFLKLAHTMTTALLLAACSQNEFSDSQGEPLPEGKYPLEISSVTMSVESSSEPWNANAPQTRVAENADGNSSHWTDGDPITVQIGDDQTNTGKYKVKVDGSGSVTGLEAETALYWKNTSSQTVKGWYPADTGSDIPLNNQGSSGLAYVLYAEVSNVNYQTANIQLPFNHLLSKIRVKPTGTKAGDVTAIEVLTYPACKFSPNEATKVAGSGTAGYISMKKVTYDNGSTYCWEANVVPGTKIEKFKINDAIEGTLTTAVTPQAAKVHEISIDVKPMPVEIQPGEDGKFTVNAGDNVLIKDYTGTAPIEVNGNATITIENVKLSTTGTVMTVKDYVSVTLNVKGQNNEITATNGNGIALDYNASINIKGDDSSSSKLVVKAGGSSNVGIGIGTSGRFLVIGDIQIENITLDVTGGTCTASGTGAAAIGLRHYSEIFSEQICNLISIVNSKVKATSYMGSCIGFGTIGETPSSQKITQINIEHSTIEGSSLGNGSDKGGACVGSGAITNYVSNAEIGTIIIKETIFQNCTVGGSYIVGYGNILNGSADQFAVTNGIIVDGTNQGNKGWNPPTPVP